MWKNQLLINVCNAHFKLKSLNLNILMWSDIVSLTFSTHLKYKHILYKHILKYKHIL